MELKDLGLTKEEVFEAVTNKVVSQLLILPSKQIDEDGEEYEDFENTPFKKSLQEHIKATIDTSITAVINKHVMPNAETYIETVVLQETTRWGEKKGEPVTFVEYLTKRAKEFMLEDVSHDGKVKGENSYSWHKKGTRIEYMIDKYLQYYIEAWAKEALTEANKSIVEGLQEAVRMKLQEVLTKLQVNVNTK